MEVDLPRNRIALSMKAKPDFEKKAGNAARPGGPGSSASSNQGGNQRPGGGGGRRPPSGNAIGTGMGNPFGGGNDWFSQPQHKK